MVLVGSAAETFRADEWSDHDRFRKVEIQYPIEAKILNDILQLPVEEAARALLDFVVTLGILNDELLLQGNVVQERLGWKIASSEVQIPSQHYPN